MLVLYLVLKEFKSIFYSGPYQQRVQPVESAVTALSAQRRPARPDARRGRGHVAMAYASHVAIPGPSMRCRDVVWCARRVGCRVVRRWTGAVLWCTITRAKMRYQAHLARAPGWILGSGTAACSSTRHSRQHHRSPWPELRAWGRQYRHMLHATIRSQPRSRIKVNEQRALETAVDSIAHEPSAVCAVPQPQASGEQGRWSPASPQSSAAQQ